MMYISITSPYQLSRYMADCERNYFSIDGYEAILEQFESLGDDVEFDPVAICSYYSEYGKNCAMTFRDLAKDFGSYALCGGWTDSQWASLSEEEQEEELKDLVGQLQAWTYVEWLPNGNILMAAF